MKALYDEPVVVSGVRFSVTTVLFYVMELLLRENSIPSYWKWKKCFKYDFLKI